MPEAAQMSGAVAEFGWPGGDVPGELAFTAGRPLVVREAIAQTLDAAGLPIGPGALRALNPGDGPAGSYAAETGTGSWFIKVTSRLGDAPLQGEITRFLAAEGVGVVAEAWIGLGLELSGRSFRVDVQPLVAGRHFAGAVEDLPKVAQLICATHRALRKFPCATLVRARAEKRAEGLDRTRREIQAALQRQDFAWFGERAEWAQQHADWLAEMTREFAPRFYQHSEAQCLHGQVHPGNVIFGQDGEPLLVDFEESVQTYAPPAWDWAIFAQRFVARTAAPVSWDSVTAWVEEFPSREAIVGMMHQGAWLSVATLVRQLREEKILAPLAEWEKFIRLQKEAALP